MTALSSASRFTRSVVGSTPELAIAAANRRDLARRAEALHRKTAELIAEAREAGVPITQVAELAGLTPQALYKLARNRSRRAGA